MNTTLKKVLIMTMFAVCLLMKGYTSRASYVIAAQSACDSSSVSREEVRPPESFSATHLSFFKKVSLAWHARRGLRQYYYGGDGNKAFGISSVAAAVLPLLAVFDIAAYPVAIVILSVLASIAAIVLGAIGIGRDRKRGLAKAGMVMGIVETSIYLVIALLFAALSLALSGGGLI